MKVICINHILDTLRKNKLYDVIKYENNEYLIINDLGKEKWYTDKDVRHFLNIFVKYIGDDVYTDRKLTKNKSYNIILCKNNGNYLVLDDNNEYFSCNKNYFINIQEE